MSRRLAVIAALAATAAAGVLATSPAAAGNVAWSVSVGAPGIAVSAGTPVFGWGAPVFRPAFRPVAPVVFPGPVVSVFPYTVPAPVVVVPRVVVRPVVVPRVVARPVFVARPVVIASRPPFGPRAPGWGWN